MISKCTETIRSKSTRTNPYRKITPGSESLVYTTFLDEYYCCTICMLHIMVELIYVTVYTVGLLNLQQCIIFSKIIVCRSIAILRELQIFKKYIFSELRKSLFSALWQCISFQLIQRSLNSLIHLRRPNPSVYHQIYKIQI